MHYATPSRGYVPPYATSISSSASLNNPWAHSQSQSQSDDSFEMSSYPAYPSPCVKGPPPYSSRVEFHNEDAYFDIDLEAGAHVKELEHEQDEEPRLDKLKNREQFSRTVYSRPSRVAYLPPARSFVQTSTSTSRSKRLTEKSASPSTPAFTNIKNPRSYSQARGTRTQRRRELANAARKTGRGCCRFSRRVCCILIAFVLFVLLMGAIIGGTLLIAWSRGQGDGEGGRSIWFWGAPPVL